MALLVLPNDLYIELLHVAKKYQYKEVLSILSTEPPKGYRDARYKFLLISNQEAQKIADVAIVYHLQAELVFPYWSDENPNYDQSHEDAYFEAQSFLQALLFCLSHFDIKTQ